MQQAILFDLDDTLIDTRQRHYHVFSDFLKTKNLSAISFEEYILHRKMNTLSNQGLLQKLFSQQKDGFADFFMDAIENPEYLKYDKPIIKDSLLEKAKTKGIKIYVLSLRSKEENAREQVKQFSFYNLMDDFIFFKHKKGYNQKAAYIKQLRINNRVKIFIGDSMYDKEAANLSGIDFCAVNTGMYQTENTVNFNDVNIALEKILN